MKNNDGRVSPAGLASTVCNLHEFWCTSGIISRSPFLMCLEEIIYSVHTWT